jgi:hypothetical protein
MKVARQMFFELRDILRCGISHAADGIGIEDGGAAHLGDSCVADPAVQIDKLAPVFLFIFRSPMDSNQDEDAGSEREGDGEDYDELRGRKST